MLERREQGLLVEVGACFHLAGQPKMLWHIKLRKELLLKLHDLLAVDA